MIDELSVRRLVENEAVFRQRNEEVEQGLKELEELAASLGDKVPDANDLELQFYCECADENCRLRFPVKLEEYADIHQNRRYFMVVPGHELMSIEKIVVKTPNYYVVEKHVDAPEQPQKLNKTEVSNV